MLSKLFNWGTSEEDKDARIKKLVAENQSLGRTNAELSAELAELRLKLGQVQSFSDKLLEACETFDQAIELLPEELRPKNVI